MSPRKGPMVLKIKIRLRKDRKKNLKVAWYFGLQKRDVLFHSKAQTVKGRRQRKGGT